LLGLQERGVRRLESVVIALVLLVASCFAFELVLSHPDLGGVLRGYIPRAQIVRDPGMLYVAIGILGATVMPHNLYLHSSLVQTRAFETTEAGKHEAVRHATLDTVISLGGAMLINSAILILAASVFHTRGRTDVAEIQDAHRLLSPLLGSMGASAVFAVALLAAGQSATITGTLSGQIVMEGFVRIRMRPWLRRMLTRGLAIIPALFVTMYAGERGTGDLLIASQVILSLQLPFAVLPLLLLTSNEKRMGTLVCPAWMRWLGWLSAIVIIALNVILIVATARAWL